jgi:hypothetical protein
MDSGNQWIGHGGGSKFEHMVQSLNMVQFHYAWGSIKCKIERPFPTIQPMDDFPGPLHFHGHDYWFVCEATLDSIILCVLQNLISIGWFFYPLSLYVCVCVCMYVCKWTMWHRLSLCGRVANIPLYIIDLGHEHYYPSGMCYSFVRSLVHSLW